MVLVFDSLKDSLVFKTLIVEKDLSNDPVITIGLEYAFKESLVNDPIIELDQDPWVEFGELICWNVFESVLLQTLRVCIQRITVYLRKNGIDPVVLHPGRPVLKVLNLAEGEDTGCHLDGHRLVISFVKICYISVDAEHELVHQVSSEVNPLRLIIVGRRCFPILGLEKGRGIIIIAS